MRIGFGDAMRIAGERNMIEILVMKILKWPNRYGYIRNTNCQGNQGANSPLLLAIGVVVSGSSLPEVTWVPS